MIQKILCLIFLILGVQSAGGQETILKVGTSLDNPPFEFLEDNVPRGYDIDLIHLIAEHLGIKIEIVDMDFGSLIPALRSGKIDLAIAGMSSTEERKQVVSFSKPYFSDNAALITRKDSPIVLLNDLHGRKVGVQLGSLSDRFIKEKQFEIEGMEVVALGRVLQLIEELKIGRLSAVVVDYMNGKALVDHNPNLKVTRLNEALEGGLAIAFPKNSPWQGKFDIALLELDMNGDLAKLNKKWLSGKKRASLAPISWLNTFYYIALGAIVTLKFTAVSIICGLILATILVLMQQSNKKNLVIFVNSYVAIFRGTPLLVQLSIFYFVIPALLGITTSAFVVGIVTFSLNSAAYLSVIINSGIRSIDQGQYEAAKSLGIPHYAMMKDIIAPQAIRNILPALVNEMADLIKESSLMAIIGEADIMRRAQLIGAERYTYIEPLLFAALCYFILISIFSYIAKVIDRKLHNVYNQN